MDIFKKTDFIELSEIQKPHCVSIYIPTERDGVEESRYKNRTRFKNQIKEANQQLQVYGLTKGDADLYLQPANDLLENENLWTDLSDTLAVFVYSGEIKSFVLPIHTEEFTYVSNHLYLSPLAPALREDGRHFILALSLGDVKFYEATQHTITPVEVEGLVPQALEETVGEELEESALQFRSDKGGQGEAIFHGHGAGNESEKKEEALKYFRDINAGLLQMLHDEKAPLVVACVDYLFPLYQQANTYQNLNAMHIAGNHEHTNLLKLKEMAWELVKDHFNNEEITAESRFTAGLDNGKAVYNPEEVIPAAIIGQAETLFIKRGHHIWGTYSPDNHKVSIDGVHKLGNADLVNKAAVETIKHGGSVYEIEDANEDDVDVKAVLRYQM